MPNPTDENTQKSIDKIIDGAANPNKQKSKDELSEGAANPNKQKSKDELSEGVSSSKSPYAGHYCDSFSVANKAIKAQSVMKESVKAFFDFFYDELQKAQANNTKISIDFDNFVDLVLKTNTNVDLSDAKALDYMKEEYEGIMQKINEIMSGPLGEKIQESVDELKTSFENQKISSKITEKVFCIDNIKKNIELANHIISMCQQFCDKIIEASEEAMKSGIKIPEEFDSFIELIFGNNLEFIAQDKLNDIRQKYINVIQVANNVEMPQNLTCALKVLCLDVSNVVDVWLEEYKQELLEAQDPSDGINDFIRMFKERIKESAVTKSVEPMVIDNVKTDVSKLCKTGDVPSVIESAKEEALNKQDVPSVIESAAEEALWQNTLAV